jgi:nucleoside-diphosphate-sugar epimerase|tara:strand:+ start:2377 stop:3321 length:945 start_codon:yes stop_codon:yes gene_type:complete
MKILVTGGTGFIGSHVAKSLYSQGYNVTICDNNSRGVIDKFIKDIPIIICDLTNPKELDKLDTDYDCVYHFAAINGTGNFYKIPHSVLRVNTLANINILDWCLKHNIPKILSTSSSEVYAATPNKSIPTNESVNLTIDDVYNPRYSYAGSKILGELLFLNYQKLGLDVRIVRPHNVYGPRMGFDHVIPQVIERIHNQESPFKIYGASQTRAFCYIDDAVNAFELIMNSPECSGKIIHLGTDEETNIELLVKKLFKISNFFPKIDLMDPLEGSVHRRCPDITFLKSIGYTPKTPLHHGLTKSYEWYVNYFRNKIL